MPPINDDEFLAWNRFQVGLAVTTGVLVIVITTAAVIFLGRQPEPGTDPAPRSRPSTIADPSELPSAVPSATPSGSPATSTPSVKPSASKKTPVPVVTTPGAVTLTLGLSCPDSAPITSSFDCEVSISAVSGSDIIVAIESDSAGALVPPEVIIPAGSLTKAFTVTMPAVPGPVIITASAAGMGSKQDTINVTV